MEELAHLWVSLKICKFLSTLSKVSINTVFPLLKKEIVSEFFFSKISSRVVDVA